MARPNIATALSSRIVNDTDFNHRFRRLELRVARAFVESGFQEELDHESVVALLRFADILSHSSEPIHRDLAYRTISLLREFDELVGLASADALQTSATTEAVLVQLGNFPGLRTLGRTAHYLPLERRIVRAAKEVVQAASAGDLTLTDAQFEIADGLRRSDFFSFSGPTSLGKSFIIKDAIFEIVQRREMEGHAIVVMVPTKALIGQTAADLRTLFAGLDNVNVAAYPSLPPFLRKRFSRTVFVFTPERLLRYLAKPERDVDYLFIDEAQRVIADNDTRSSLFYHAISETTRRFATKLVFACPSIQNPEIFLELFQKSTTGSLVIRERTVSQQRYFIDLVDRTAELYSTTGAQEALTLPASFTDPLGVVETLSAGRKGIIYLNGSGPAAQMALQMAARLPAVSGDPQIDELISYVTSYIHDDYYLAQCLRHGVAFHHGKMPQEVREHVERVFASSTSQLAYVFCTSTLLEGVNMPAKNIFVLSDKHGSKNFVRIDFENLVGRAGRLTYDFSGNVVCIRFAADPWSGSTRGLIAQGDPTRAHSFLVDPGRTRKAYTDIARVLRGQALPVGTTADQLKSVQQYASILIVHQLDQQSTPLKTNFLDKVKDGREVLRRSTTEIATPADILRRSPDILPKYQDRVLAFLSAPEPTARRVLIPEGSDLASVETYLTLLTRLKDLYGWLSEETLGRDPLISPNSDAGGVAARLLYWATLMRSWVRGDPLRRVIQSQLAYVQSRNEIRYRDFSQSPYLIAEPFNPKSTRHINIVIEDTLRDLEGGLRFRIIAYLQNYFELSRLTLGEDAGINVATLVEYGTTDSRSIELQEIGLSRHSANLLIKNYSQALRFDLHEQLVEIRASEVLADPALDADLRLELENIMQNIRA